MKKIVHIIPTLRFGGAERFVVDLIKGGDHENFKYSIVLFFDDQPLAKELESLDADIKVVEKKGKIDLGLVGRLKEVLAEMEPDIVHTHLFGADVWGRLAAKKLGLPVVTTEHNVNKDEGFVKHLVKRVLKDKTDAYTACSKEVKEYMGKAYGIKKDVLVTYFGVDIHGFASVSPIQDNEGVNLLMLGRLVEQKGHEIAIRALSGLKEYNWHLYIVGEGEREGKLKKLVKELDIGNRVDFSPPTNDVVGVLQNNEVVLMPSLWEGLGIVALEAMAAGRLVITSNVGGLLEIVKHKENGLLFDVGDVDLSRKQIKDVFENKEEYYTLGEKARDFVEKGFSREKMIKQYSDLYKKLV